MIGASHQFQRRTLNARDENGNEGCASCGRPRDAHPAAIEAPPPQPAPESADSRPASMLQPVTFDDEPELTEHISIRFPADMIAAAKQMAAAEGMAVSTWIRREVEREAGRREQPAPELAAATDESTRYLEALKSVFAVLDRQTRTYAERISYARTLIRTALEGK